MKILAIDTSCDETAAAVTEDTKILSNVIWSQASLHAKFGGVMPSLAQRMHEERIDFVIKKALTSAKCLVPSVDAIAVTVGPGLAIALGVGINKAKELAKKYHKPLMPVNHVEAHLLSPLAISNSKFLGRSPKDMSAISNQFPILGLVVSGGNTVLAKINKIGSYKVLAETQDDALGEALDKAARMLGLGYPGGAILEKFAKNGNPKTYPLPVPLIGDKVKNRFSYSGLKTSFYRLVEKARLPDGQEKPLTKQKIYDLAASFQEVAFYHIINILTYQINILNPKSKILYLFFGGGVANNILLRSKLRKLLRPYGITLRVPYTKKLCGDNAAMIGACAYLKLKAEDKKLKDFIKIDSIDRDPRLKW